MARIPRRLAGIGASDLTDATAFDAYVGPAREITVDQLRGIIALHDGTTPGGRQFNTGTGELADNSVSTSILQDEAVTEEKLAPAVKDKLASAVQDKLAGPFKSKADAKAFEPVAAPEFIQIVGYAASGDGGSALYKKVASEPSHAGKFSITLADGVTVAWFELAEQVYRPEMFGAVGDLTESSGVPSGTDNAAALQAMFSAGREGQEYDFGSGQYLYTTTINVTKSFKITGKGWRLWGVGAYFYARGTLTANVTSISAAAAANSRTVSVLSSAGLAKDDLVILHNHVNASLNSQRPYYYDGEFQEVLSAASGTSVSFKRAIETNYPALTTSEVHKVNPISAVLENGTLQGAIDVSTPWAVWFQYIKGLRSKNMNYIGGNTRCVYVDKCYDFKFDGGEAIHTVSGTGAGYGIGAGNSQDGIIKGMRIHADNHSIAMGGNDANGSVPCRHVYVEDCDLSNQSASQSTADQHGNCVDCGYRKNRIDGSIGLSGHDVFATDNIVRMRPDATSEWPFTIKEIGGGRIEYSDNVVHLGANFAGGNRIIGFEASSLTEKINADFRIVANRNIIHSKNAAVAYFGFFYYNGRRFVDDNIANPEIAWHIECNDNKFAGDRSGLTNVLRIDTAVASTPYTFAAVGPKTVSVNNFITDTQMGNTVTLCQMVVNAGAGGFGNTILTLPEYALSGTLTIPNGGIQSGNLTLDHPVYPGVPEISVSAAGQAGPPVISAVCVTAAANQTIARLVATAAVGAAYARSTQIRVGMKSRKLG